MNKEFGPDLYLALLWGTSAYYKVVFICGAVALIGVICLCVASRMNSRSDTDFFKLNEYD